MAGGMIMAVVATVFGGAAVGGLWSWNRKRRLERMLERERDPAFYTELTANQILDNPKHWTRRLEGLVSSVQIARQMYMPEGGEASHSRRVVFIVDSNGETHDIDHDPVERVYYNSGNSRDSYMVVKTDPELPRRAKAVADLFGVPFLDDQG